MNGQNPCNICTNKTCEELENYGDCVWQHIYDKSFSCDTYDCMLNYEGSCLGSLYGRCGCQG